MTHHNDAYGVSVGVACIGPVLLLRLRLLLGWLLSWRVRLPLLLGLGQRDDLLCSSDALPHSSHYLRGFDDL